MRQFVDQKNARSLASSRRLHNPKTPSFLKFLREHNVLAREEESGRQEIPFVLIKLFLLSEFPLVLPDILHEHILAAQLH